MTRFSSIAYQAAAPTDAPHASVLQRQCACGGTPGPTGECAACRRERRPDTEHPPLQTKLRVSQPGDAQEREADRIAARVMRMPDQASTSSSALPIRPAHPNSGHPVARQTTPDPEDEIKREDLLSMKEDVGGSHDIPGGFEAQLASMQGGGQPLDTDLRASFEHRFGHDFSRVRVHADTRAAQSAQSIGARAYTLGRDIVFGSGAYRPEHRSGQALIAHELVHVVQQRNHPHAVMRACDCSAISGARGPTAGEETSLSSHFPKLVSGDWCVTGPATGTYNCIAWSVGDTSQWIWDQVDTYGDNDGTVTIPDFDAFYDQTRGLIPSEHPSSNTRVALFAKGNAPTHAAPFNPNTPSCGAIPFTSKLGQSVRISHDLYQLEGGPTYGDIVRYYDA